MRRSPARHPLQPPQYMPMYYPPEPRRVSAGAIIGAIGTIVLALAAVTVAAVFVWKATGGVLPSALSLPTRAAIVPSVSVPPDYAPRPNTQTDIDIYSAAQQATAAAIVQPAVAPAQAPAVAPVVDSTLPTAAILIPTAIPIERITVVPQRFPALAAGSDMRPTPIVVMPYPTPLPAAIANDFEVSPDGTCITAPRGGKRYQVCQGWKYSPAEIATVADLIRGGTLPGVEVQ